jgi:2'-5' RNA ligase
MRCFIAIPLDRALAQEIGRLQRQLAPALPPDAVRWVRADQLHLTLRFLGEVPEDRLPALEEPLHRACTPGAPLRLALNGLGCFPNPARPRVVWVGVHGDTDALRRLQERVAAATAEFGDQPPEQVFHPHLTIGRVKSRDPATLRRVGEAVGAASVGPLGPWTVGEVTLFSSLLAPQGPTYTELARLPLAP